MSPPQPAPSTSKITASHRLLTLPPKLQPNGWHISRTIQSDGSLCSYTPIETLEYAKKLGVGILRVCVVLPDSPASSEKHEEGKGNLFGVWEGWKKGWGKFWSEGVSFWTMKKKKADGDVSVAAVTKEEDDGKVSESSSVTAQGEISEHSSSARQPPTETLPQRDAIMDENSIYPAHFQTLKTLLQLASEQNCFLILRFYYENGEPQDFSVIQRDFKSFAPLLNSYRDVILTLQAGFLGCKWGEWWGSAMAPDVDEGKDPKVEHVKKSLIEMMKQNLEGVCISLRYPRDIANYFDADPRIGWHNDAILAQGPGGRDAGTFDKGSKIWQTDHLPLAQSYAKHYIAGIRGGECCSDAGSPPTFAQLADYVQEYGICYLNVEYPEGFLEGYKEFLEKGEGAVGDVTKELSKNLKGWCERQVGVGFDDQRALHGGEKEV
ncbi:hypothetical protein HDV05_006651 [Chytridiales sp. JEL 0842]|nr:hypothetical protein HDV05_006651 [Chytridiales sp. JEL 0842]